MNLFPTLMKLSFPAFCFVSLLLFVDDSNNARINLSLDSQIKDSRDIWSASLFFSTNWVWKKNQINCFHPHCDKHPLTDLWENTNVLFPRWPREQATSVWVISASRSWICKAIRVQKARGCRTAVWLQHQPFSAKQCCTHCLIAHCSCKVPDDKTFIVSEVPVHCQLRLPGNLRGKCR